MRPRLPASFLKTPLAHRGLHDRKAGRPENSLAAIRAAIKAGYGIEIDLQRTADGQAAVFHDEALQRLTGRKGHITDLHSDELGDVALLGGDEGIPLLSQVLALVAGQVPLLIEIKDQDGRMGAGIGALEQAVADALAGYTGPVALMSFNPHAVLWCAEHIPQIPRGLVTCSYRAEDWDLPGAQRTRLREIPDFDVAGCAFISHERTDLDNSRVAEIKTAGYPVLCWTVRSPDAEADARKIADNITFEQYLPQMPS